MRESQNLPIGWRVSLLDDVTKRGSGHTPNKEHAEYWNGGIKWVSLADSSSLDKGLISQTDKEISELGIANSSAVMHPAGTVVMSRDAGVGKSAILGEDMAVSQHFIAWRCNGNGQVHNWFLYNWLQFHKQEFERQAIGSTIKTIGLPYFKRLKIAYPPYGEQRRIAEILSTWDRAIETTEKLIANSQAQKKALMQQLLTGKKRLPGFEKAWRKCQFGDVAQVKKGKALSGKDLRPGSYPVIAGGKVSPYSHAEFTHENVVTVSASGAYAGYVSFHDSQIWASDCSVIEGNSALDVRFAHQFLSWRQERLYSLQSGGAQPHIYPKDIASLDMLLPALAEQKAIAVALALCDEATRSLTDQLDHLEDEKRALMQQLLTGKRRVKIEEAAA